MSILLLAAGKGGAGVAPVATDPSFANVEFLSGFNGVNGATAAVDEARSKAITFAGNAQLDTSQFKFGVSSVKFDGAGDYLSVATTVGDWSFGSGQFTVELWVRPTTGFSAEEALLGQWGTSFPSWFLFRTGSSLRWTHQTSGGAFENVTAAWAPSLDTWHHVAADRDAGGKIRIYAGGTMLGSSTLAAAIAGFVSPPPLLIGALGGFPGTYDLNGYVDEVRITKGVARYASDAGFAVPTAAFPRS